MSWARRDSRRAAKYAEKPVTQSNALANVLPPPAAVIVGRGLELD